jgi:DNA replication protein DnaC
MERSQLFDLMGELKLYGMKAAFDEIMATAVKRQHEPQRLVGDLLNAEITEKQARSIKYQLSIAKLPLAKDLEDFQFEGTPINQTLVNDLAGGGFIAQQRNAVLVGGTGTGKTQGHCHCEKLHSLRRPRPFLQCGRSSQPARDRGPQRTTGSAR